MDSELQIALIGAGIAVVVLIVAYNKWQERKHRREAERAFKSEHRDVLLEPQVGGSATAERREPGLAEEDGPRRFNEAPLKRSAPSLPDLLDARADCVIHLEVIEPLEMQRLWQLQSEYLAGLGKPVRWFGFDDTQNQWHALGPERTGACHWFCAGLQLVDRQGSIGEADFMRFTGGVQRVADAVMALPPGLPLRAETLRNAAELDRFCADVDVQIGVNVVARERQFEGAEVQRLAEQLGLGLAGDGSFHAVDDGGATLFTLSNLEPELFVEGGMARLVTRGLTFVIDVPHVADGVTAFDRLMRTASDLAERLEGSVVDDNRTPFGADAAALIRAQVEQFQQRMAERGISAGGLLARRLFSV